jgi:8-oxo-dGTP pyrophosphatase MutT (NUDIX family)
VPLFRDDEGELRLVLVVRGALGRHAHQLSLPGGKHEPGDASLLETALRETEEEIGLARAEVEVIAALPAIDTRTTRFRVHPYLARIRRPESWRLAQGEIAEVIIPRVRTLADPSLRRDQLLSFPGWPKPASCPVPRARRRTLALGAHATAPRAAPPAATERRVRNLRPATAASNLLPTDEDGPMLWRRRPARSGDDDGNRRHLATVDTLATWATVDTPRERIRK